MEFDKSRVYTALNADELQIGSKCFFANNLAELKIHVEHEFAPNILIKVLAEDHENRFAADFYQGEYPLVYLVEPAETKYRPFISYENLITAIKRHGTAIREKKNKNSSIHLFAITVKGVAIITCEGESFGFYSPAVLLEDYVFADDDSPCGELVEETKNE